MKYSNSLFRKEAIEGQHRDKLGNPLRLPSPQHLVVVCLLLLVTASFIYLLITHTYTNKVNVVGWLVAEKASVDIYPIEQNSLLADIPVTSNQIVSKGEVLAHLVRPNS
jgi:multidrug efflux pump subunit AcrA (membrane-fusion protein)